MGHPLSSTPNLHSGRAVKHSCSTIGRLGLLVLNHGCMVSRHRIDLMVQAACAIIDVINTSINQLTGLRGKIATIVIVVNIII
jgi:hypothetical protein